MEDFPEEDQVVALVSLNRIIINLRNSSEFVLDFWISKIDHQIE